MDESPGLREDLYLLLPLLDLKVGQLLLITRTLKILTATAQQTSSSILRLHISLPLSLSLLAVALFKTADSFPEGVSLLEKQ